MNEEQLDKLFDIIEEGYYEALEFTQENCDVDDEETFRKVFQTKIKPTLIKVRDLMTDVAVEDENGV